MTRFCRPYYLIAICTIVDAETAKRKAAQRKYLILYLVRLRIPSNPEQFHKETGITVRYDAQVGNEALLEKVQVEHRLRRGGPTNDIVPPWFV
jgi:hypothetical protein